MGNSTVSQENIQQRKIGFAIAGMGKLTESQLLPAFKECKYAQVVALIGSDDEELKDLGAKNNIPTSSLYNYDDFDEIAKNKEIDVVYIVLPNSKHKEFTIRSAKAGKHVLCEKPMAVSVEEAQAMIDVCKAHDRLLMIAYRIQYEAHHKLIKKWIDEKKFGNINVIETFNGEYISDASQWRFKKELSGGGSLMDLGIYCVNTMRYLAGNEPLWVSANSYSTPYDERFKEVEETVLFQMGFPNNILINCGCSYSVSASQHYRIHTENEGWFGMDPAFAYNNLQIQVVKEKNKDFELPHVNAENQFAALLDHMAQCILTNKQPITPGEEGLQDMKIIEAIYKSAKQKTVIQIGE